MGQTQSTLLSLQILKVAPASVAHKSGLIPFVHFIYTYNSNPIQDISDIKKMINIYQTECVIELSCLDIRDNSNICFSIKNENAQPLGMSVKMVRQPFLLSLYILSIYPSSPAFYAGLIPNQDIIIGIENVSCATEEAFFHQLSAHVSKLNLNNNLSENQNEGKSTSNKDCSSNPDAKSNTFADNAKSAQAEENVNVPSKLSKNGIDDEINKNNAEKPLKKDSINKTVGVSDSEYIILLVYNLGMKNIRRVYLRPSSDELLLGCEYGSGILYVVPPGDVFYDCKMDTRRVNMHIDTRKSQSISSSDTPNKILSENDVKEAVRQAPNVPVSSETTNMQDSNTANLATFDTIVTSLPEVVNIPGMDSDLPRTQNNADHAIEKNLIAHHTLNQTHKKPDASVHNNDGILDTVKCTNDKSSSHQDINSNNAKSIQDGSVPNVSYMARITRDINHNKSVNIRMDSNASGVASSCAGKADLADTNAEDVNNSNAVSASADINMNLCDAVPTILLNETMTDTSIAGVDTSSPACIVDDLSRSVCKVNIQPTNSAHSSSAGVFVDDTAKTELIEDLLSGNHSTDTPSLYTYKDPYRTEEQYNKTVNVMHSESSTLEVTIKGSKEDCIKSLIDERYIDKTKNDLFKSINTEAGNTVKDENHTADLYVNSTTNEECTTDVVSENPLYEQNTSKGIREYVPSVKDTRKKAEDMIASNITQQSQDSTINSQLANDLPVSTSVNDPDDHPPRVKDIVESIERGDVPICLGRIIDNSIHINIKNSNSGITADTNMTTVKDNINASISNTSSITNKKQDVLSVDSPVNSVEQELLDNKLDVVKCETLKSLIDTNIADNTNNIPTGDIIPEYSDDVYLNSELNNNEPATTFHYQNVTLPDPIELNESDVSLNDSTYKNYPLDNMCVNKSSVHEDECLSTNPTVTNHIAYTDDTEPYNTNEVPMTDERSMLVDLLSSPHDDQDVCYDYTNPDNSNNFEMHKTTDLFDDNNKEMIYDELGNNIISADRDIDFSDDEINDASNNDETYGNKLDSDEIDKYLSDAHITSKAMSNSYQSINNELNRYIMNDRGSSNKDEIKADNTCNVAQDIDYSTDMHEGCYKDLRSSKNMSPSLNHDDFRVKEQQTSAASDNNVTITLDSISDVIRNDHYQPVVPLSVDKAGDKNDAVYNKNISPVIQQSDEKSLLIRDLLEGNCDLSSRISNIDINYDIGQEISLSDQAIEYEKTSIKSPSYSDPGPLHPSTLSIYSTGQEISLSDQANEYDKVIIMSPSYSDPGPLHPSTLSIYSTGQEISLSDQAIEYEKTSIKSPSYSDPGPLHPSTLNSYSTSTHINEYSNSDDNRDKMRIYAEQECDGTTNGKQQDYDSSIQAMHKEYNNSTGTDCIDNIIDSLNDGYYTQRNDNNMLHNDIVGVTDDEEMSIYKYTYEELMDLDYIPMKQSTDLDLLEDIKDLQIDNENKGTEERLGKPKTDQSRMNEEQVHLHNSAELSRSEQVLQGENDVELKSDNEIDALPDETFQM